MNSKIKIVKTATKSISKQLHKLRDLGIEYISICMMDREHVEILDDMHIAYTFTPSGNKGRYFNVNEFIAFLRGGKRNSKIKIVKTATKSISEQLHTLHDLGIEYISICMIDHGHNEILDDMHIRYTFTPSGSKDRYFNVNEFIEFLREEEKYGN